MLGLVVTGYKVHGRILKTLRRPVLRRDRGARVWWGGVYRVLGAWLLPFVLIIALTGAWFLPGLEVSWLQLPERRTCPPASSARAPRRC